MSALAELEEALCSKIALHESLLTTFSHAKKHIDQAYADTSEFVLQFKPSQFKPAHSSLASTAVFC